jgi:hypothetical protein
MDNINFEELAKSESDKLYYVSHCINNANSVPFIFEMREFGEIVTLNGAPFTKKLFDGIVDEYFKANDYFSNFLEKCEKVYYSAVAYIDVPEGCTPIETVTATFRLVTLVPDASHPKKACDDDGNDNGNDCDDDKFALVLTDVMIDDDPKQLIDPKVINEIIAPECELDSTPVLYENYFGKCLEYVNAADTKMSYMIYPQEIRYHNGEKIKLEII